ncbi:alpha/beta hydrolase [Blastococcus brunescens]|uniref:Alpha/beta hydrolase n=1 Tax=Blastococcus brunescens TaxID=1564165 RepID=A0ABZ1B8M6_9ACTN|nr:alpha/beta hydrolase [Blastococcus sp. BMG 8361]WRL67145.1 alpha/beta hydrolase [Blastococcus sp. BMG 8361]
MAGSPAGTSAPPGRCDGPPAPVQALQRAHRRRRRGRRGPGGRRDGGRRRRHPHRRTAGARPARAGRGLRRAVGRPPARGRPARRGLAARRPDRARAGRRRRAAGRRGDRAPGRAADRGVRARLHALDGVLDLPAAHAGRGTRHRERAPSGRAAGVLRPAWPRGLRPGAPEQSTIEQLARDLAAVLDARVPRGPVVLVGHSMGGMTIMGLAALRPELFGPKVVAAALISTSSGQLADLSFGLPELLTRVRATVLPIAAWTMRRRPAIAERTRRVAADVVSAATRWLSFASKDVDPALVRYVDSMIAGTPVDVIAEFYPALAGLDETGSLDALRDVPTLVLTGDKDAMIPMAHSELLLERLGRDGDGLAEYVVVPDAGHMVLLEQPGAVTEAIAALLRRVGAGVSAGR